MGLIEDTVEKDGFKAKVYYLTCEVTQRKLVEILVYKDNNVLEEEVFVEVEATSPFADNATSGRHKIGGLLFFGPITPEDSPRFPTKLIDVDYAPGVGEYAKITVGQDTTEEAEV